MSVLCYYCRTPIGGEPAPGWHDEPYCRGCVPTVESWGEDS